MTDPLAALHEACRVVGVHAGKVELIRAGENHLYRLPGKVVARITRQGQQSTAAKEIRVARWLRDTGLPSVEPLPDIDQPVEVDGRAVTFWRELPPHREGTIEQVAVVLRALHQLSPPPQLLLPALAPFVRVEERIAEATFLSADDRVWLSQHARGLHERYQQFTAHAPLKAVHGDAWGGNIVATADGPVILDLERFSHGPPEWDLASIAVDYLTFGTTTRAEWEFCAHYGSDVTAWDGFPLLRDIRELRKVTFAVQMATQDPRLIGQAVLRLRCVQGSRGPRPWRWQPVP